MKYLLTTAVILLTTATAQADKVNELCTAVSKNASMIMELRQSNAPLSGVLEAVKGVDILETLAMEAYKKPRYSSEEYKTGAIADFGNLAMITCLQAFKDRVKS